MMSPLIVYAKAMTQDGGWPCQKDQLFGRDFEPRSTSVNSVESCSIMWPVIQPTMPR